MSIDHEIEKMKDEAEFDMLLAEIVKERIASNGQEVNVEDVMKSVKMEINPNLIKTLKSGIIG